MRVLNRLFSATRVNSPKVAIAWAEQALSLAEELSDRPGRIRALNNIGIGHYYLAEYVTALEYYRRSLALAEELGDDELLANALNNIGVIHYVWGEYDDALEHYSRVLEVRKRSGEKQGLASAHNNLGNVYYATGNYESALEFLDTALILYQEAGEQRWAASTLDNIGLAYLKLGRHDESLEHFERALEIGESVGAKPQIALSLNNIGMVHGEQGGYRDSLEYYRQSLAVREEIEDLQGVVICKHNIGQAYARLGEFTRSLEFLHEARVAAAELKLKEVERDVHLTLSETYEEMDDPARALEAYKSYKELNDGLFGDETARRLAELQTRYDVEKKDREIEVLLRDQQIQRIVRNVSLAGLVLLVLLILLLYRGYRLKSQANREMRKANEALKLAQAEKEKAARAELAHVSRVAVLGELATALAHELNQPLTAILSNAQATRRLLAAGDPRPAALDEVLVDIVDGAGRAREIIQRLRGLIRRGEITREPLDINRVMLEVKQLAVTAAAEHGVRLALRLAPGLPQVTGDRIQLQQVLLNLVRNGAEAMSGTDGDEIEVTTSWKGEDGILVAVRDRGPEVDDATLGQMFRPFFTSKEQGLGMGLPICSTIIEAHDGRLWAERNPDRGLTVQFVLPGGDSPEPS